MASLISGIIGILVALFILWLMRKDRLHVSHGLGWILVAASFAALGFAPTIFDNLAHWIGIEYPPVLALTLGLAILVLKILLMDIERSKLEMRNQRLVQRIAMLEADMQRLQSDELRFGDLPLPSDDSQSNA